MCKGFCLSTELNINGVFLSVCQLALYQNAVLSQSKIVIVVLMMENETELKHKDRVIFLKHISRCCL